MATCTLSFDFSKRNTSASPGDEFAGQVVVKVDAPCRCDGLTLAAQWRTSGKGNETSGQAEAQTLFKGQWEQGEHRYRFTYKAPVGPFSYDGEFLKIGWTLRARADIPWALDPKVEAPFVLKAGADSETTPYFFGPSYKPPDPSTQGISPSEGGKVVVKPPMSLPMKLLIGAFAVIIGGSLIAAIPAMAACILPFVAFFLIKAAMVKSKLGEPDVKLFPNPLRAGETFAVVARLTPKKEVKFGNLYAEVVGVERVVSGSGKHSHTHTHPLYTYRHPIPFGAREVRAGEAIELRANLTMPPNAPLTFFAPSNTVAWTVKLSIELLGWPDWQKTFPLTVRPGALGRELAGFSPREP